MGSNWLGSRYCHTMKICSAFRKWLIWSRYLCRSLKLHDDVAAIDVFLEMYLGMTKGSRNKGKKLRINVLIMVPNPLVLVSGSWWVWTKMTELAGMCLMGWHC